MDGPFDQLEILWNDLLSREDELVRKAFFSLEPAGRQSVLEHLRRMVSEPGWQAEQRNSARVAIKAIENLEQEESWKSTS